MFGGSDKQNTVPNTLRLVESCHINCRQRHTSARLWIGSIVKVERNQRGQRAIGRHFETVPNRRCRLK